MTKRKTNTVTQANKTPLWKDHNTCLSAVTMCYCFFLSNNWCNQSHDCEYMDRFWCLLRAEFGLVGVCQFSSNAGGPTPTPPPSPYFHEGHHTERAGVIPMRNMELEFWRVQWRCLCSGVSAKDFNHLPIVRHSQQFVCQTLFLPECAKCLWRHLLSHYRLCHHRHHHYPQNAHQSKSQICLMVRVIFDPF